MRTDQVRAPVAAGTFYPADEEVLAGAVDALLAAGAARAGEGTPRAVIVPHAGYRYSGPVAASAYALLRPVARAIVLGPAHFARLHGMAVPGADAWATPLGEVAIDAELRELAVRCGVAVDDEPHGGEHALEVQLPFLQRITDGRISVLPIAVGSTRPAEVADLLDALDDLPDRVIVVSTDLSHYHDAETARTLDRRTADAVLAREPRSIRLEDACGVFALRGIVEHARRRELPIRLLDLRTSADTAGDPWRVVGYGAFAI